MYRRNSHIESIKAMRLREVYQKNAAAEGAFAKTAQGRWLNAIRTVLRGVRAVNAFLPQEYRRKKKEAENQKMGKKKTAWQKVKKTAVQHAVQNKMAQDFKVDTQSAVKQVGFQFGKSADKKLFENCLRILKTEKKRRTRPDLGMLLTLLKDNQFFSKLSHEVKLDLASVMSLSSVKHGVNVFKQGDVGNLFYIVLRGECDVFVTHMGISFKAVTYGVGGAFGERALLTSEPRAATVTCTVNCDFLVIQRRDYLRVLRETHEREFTGKMAFLKTVRYLENLPNQVCEEIAQKFSKKRYGANQVIVKEGSKKTHLHILRNGECRVLKKVDMGGDIGNVQMETRHLSSRDFFCEEDCGTCRVSVVSISFAEVYSIHVNDLKSNDSPALREVLEEIKAFSDKFKIYKDEAALKGMYLKEKQWGRVKDRVIGELKMKVKGKGGESGSGSFRVV
ncbi:hypothetical protein TrRE_jg9537 [Triparma retinervis]|uniref:Cyclic nucleotide-binding domain-containing protein n=1 Tax=Triparma retinervis TaxID=2557542 RepID=A0A9W7G050_9STRA|nr:hypothetical protein TrRE_jg9537 [Triparma retinervis]